MVGQQETGNETYALGLLEGFKQIGFGLDTYSFASLGSGPFRQHRVWPHQSIVRIPVSLPLLALRDRLDVFHATYVLPPLLPCAGVVTVHDISFALHPDWFEPGVRGMLNRLVPASMRRARLIITISESSRRDIVDRFGVAREKVAVTYLAPRPAFAAAPPRATGAADPFYLFVGNIQPRKNVGTLLRALRILLDRGLEVPLVIAGARAGAFPDVERLVTELRLEPFVRFLGYVPDGDLLELYRTCTALVHPALYEGFGLTPVEAMAQGAPVIASAVSSLPEVIGEAGLLVDPTKPEAWADAMARVTEDGRLRAELTRKALRQQARFSWERCARETIEVYRRALRRPKSFV